MTSLDKYFGNFLKVEDVEGETEAIVESVVPQEIESEDGSKQKLVIRFEGFDKPLALNRTNAEAMAEITGTREVEDWVGARVCLFVDKSVTFHGKKVGGVRIKEAEPAQEKL